MKLKTIVYDFEVTAFDWIVVFRDIESEDHTVFHNDYDEIHAFINKVKKDLLVGFNNKHYDDYILKAIYHRATPEKVKELQEIKAKQAAAKKAAAEKAAAAKAAAESADK